jgi:hypothetical protein
VELEHAPERGHERRALQPIEQRLEQREHVARVVALRRDLPREVRSASLGATTSASSNMGMPAFLRASSVGRTEPSGSSAPPKRFLLRRAPGAKHASRPMRVSRCTTRSDSP